MQLRDSSLEEVSPYLKRLYSVLGVDILIEKEFVMKRMIFGFIIEDKLIIVLRK